MNHFDKFLWQKRFDHVWLNSISVIFFQEPRPILPKKAHPNWIDVVVPLMI